MPKLGIPIWRYLLEIALVVVIALFATRIYLDDRATTVFSASEFEWLTSSATSSAQFLREHGRIPLWQPDLARGEPAVENAFAFVFNPFSMVPSLLFDSEVGTRYSVVLAAVIAGVGGWAIGYALGLSTVGRVLLGVLMVAKGSMPSVIGAGYFQLGTTQAYLPWVLAGTLAIARWREARAPVVLLALALALMWFGGNVYYILPAGLLVVAVGGAFVIRRPRGQPFTLDLALLRRYALALCVAGALMSVTAIPIVASYDRVANHPDEKPDSFYEHPLTAAAQLFTAQPYFEPGTWTDNYDLFVIPVLYAALLFVVFPPFIPQFSRPAQPRVAWRIVTVGLIFALFFLLWGTGTNPLMRWAITNVPGIGQWRVLSRMLTLVSLWLAVIVALRFDSLWRALVLPLDRRWLRRTIGIALLAFTVVMVREPLDSYRIGAQTVNVSRSFVSECIRWLRDSYPRGELDIFVRDYRTITVYLREHIGFTHINADYHLVGRAPTIFPYDLRRHYARYFFGIDAGDRAYWQERGYVPMLSSPPLPTGEPCLMEYPNALPYAFAAPRSFLERYVAPDDPVPSVQFRGLTGDQVFSLPYYVHQGDWIALRVQSLPYQEVVVVLGELAWQGWTVTVDGKDAPVESVGQLIGVILPDDNAVHDILFRYDPPLFRSSAAITIAVAGVLVLWLLGVNRRLSRVATILTGRSAFPLGIG